MAAANKRATWPAATAPNQVWVGDSTYLALATGHGAYLVCWRDAFSRRVVGAVSPRQHYAHDAPLHTGLILTAFNRAVAVWLPPPRLLVHADRGPVPQRHLYAAPGPHPGHCRPEPAGQPLR